MGKYDDQRHQSKEDLKQVRDESRAKDDAKYEKDKD